MGNVLRARGQSRQCTRSLMQSLIELHMRHKGVRLECYIAVISVVSSHNERKITIMLLVLLSRCA